MKKSKTGCDLKSCFLCTLCTRAWLPALGAHRQCLQYGKGELIFSEGEPVQGIYFLYRGRVKVHKQWGTEKELILRFAGQGDILGHRGLGQDNLYPISATALEPVTACYIDLPFFESTLRVNYDFIHGLMMFFAEELKLSERKMRNLAHMPVRGRVAQSLLLLQDKFGQTEEGCIDFTLSRQDLASFSGTTYETVFRLLNEFSGEGILALSGKDIRILDAEKLKSFTLQQTN